MKITILNDDITELPKYDAIVNAANESLTCGSGVDEDIHRAAGAAELHTACMEHPEIVEDIRCPTGQVRVTPAFNLNATYVIHVVGPRWKTGSYSQPMLKVAYHSIIKKAEELDCKRIAIPCISTGAHGFPPVEAASAAITALLQTRSEIEVTLVANDAENYKALLNRTSQ
jgi:O-acetyl-ADP-ribose deacetylase (regulator of RNase III)